MSKSTTSTFSIAMLNYQRVNDIGTFPCHITAGDLLVCLWVSKFLNSEYCVYIIWLVVWNIFYFFIYLGIITPTDYFSEGLKPPTRYNIYIYMFLYACF